ncbi:MAG: hypothetical protein C7B47_02230 [Sulfobacillus thermosulfidooxidans]|uniref:Uncharacterized protein n=1 Tax=Sulfobacillus thermosulfidooxidans TaxID=28034 RepID=A0A2T2X530_SULTH|nr:MAG: hypothetical protein C7B47_02230 [Sulfobacillus thermosulfidooxidans]
MKSQHAILLTSALAFSLTTLSSFAPATVNAFSLPGPIYKLPNKPTVYIERNGKMHAIANETIFYDLGYQFTELHVVNTLPAPIGSAVDLFKLPNKPQVYWYSQGTLHWIVSAQIFVARGFQWDNIYTVSQLPGPIGSPISASTTPPASTPPATILPLVGFPDVIVGQTKDIVIDGLTSLNQVDQSYSGTIPVTLSDTSHNFSIWNGSSWISSGTVKVSLHDGTGIIQVKSGNTPWQSADLIFGSSGSQDTQQLTSVPDTTKQVGWRVFTDSSQPSPVSGEHPAYLKGSSTFLIEPVDAHGKIVPGTLADKVDVTADPQVYVGSCPFSSTQCNIISSPYVSTKGIAFIDNQTLFSSSTPIVFSLTPQTPAQAQVTAVTPKGSSSSITPSALVKTPSGDIQTVGDILPNHSYVIQLQLQTSSGQPILGLPELGLTTSTQISLYQNKRSTPSTLSFEKAGENHLYFLYNSGSEDNSPDVLALFGSPPGNNLPPVDQSIFLELITNSF